MDKVYVMICFDKGSSEPQDIQVFDFEDSDLAYDTQDDYRQHSEYDRVEMFLVPRHLTKV